VQAGSVDWRRAGNAAGTTTFDKLPEYLRFVAFLVYFLNHEVTTETDDIQGGLAVTVDATLRDW